MVHGMLAFHHRPMAEPETPTKLDSGPLSAGVIVVRQQAPGWVVLVLRAYRNWDFPKGMVEPGETPLDAALREAAEEAAINDLVFRWGKAFCETAPYGAGKVA